MEKYFEILKEYNLWNNNKPYSGRSRPKYLKALLEQSNNNNISAVIGVRRSGKSTILKQLLKSLIRKKITSPNNTFYLNLEEIRLHGINNESTLNQLIEHFDQKISGNGRKYIVLDEVQNIDNWEILLRNIIDRRSDIKFYITGSSAKLLGSELGTKLSGRYFTNEVFPLDLEEFQDFNGSQLMIDYINYGGFPNIALEGNKNLRDQLLEDYFNSILLRDITQRYNIRNSKSLKDLAIYLFSNNSKLVSIPQFQKLLGLSPDTINNYFDHIEQAFLGFFVPKFSFSLKKQIYNPKKFYAIDTALQQRASFLVLDNIGKNFENIVFLHLRKMFKDNIYYWTKIREVDFVIKQGTAISFLINVSWNIDNEDTLKREVDGLNEAMLDLGLNESYIVTESEARIIENEYGKIHVISLHDLISII